MTTEIDDKSLLIVKATKICDYICNRNICEYKKKLIKSIENELHDASIIYAWNLFMIFIYEKIWQIRQIEGLEGKFYQTDKVFLSLCKKGTKPDNYFDGNLFSLNKLNENKIGEDCIIAKSKEVFVTVDQQFFKEAQQILQKRNTCAHANSCDVSADDLKYVLSNLIKIISEIEKGHLLYINKFFDGALLNCNECYFSVVECEYLVNKVEKITDSQDIDIFSKLIVLIDTLNFSEDNLKTIKQKAINWFITSNSFQIAYDVGEKIILPMIKHFNQDDIIFILNDVFDNKGCMYNQILQAKNMDKIFMQMFDSTVNFSDDIRNEWIGFKNKLIENNFHNNFRILISNINEMYVDQLV